MFVKVLKTAHKTNTKPIIAWDGECGFCRYWMLRWKKVSGDTVIYKPYQQIAYLYPDISLAHFQKAVRLIDVDGSVYGGPAAIFMIFHYAGRYRLLNALYHKIKPIRMFFDISYWIIARHRKIMYRISVAMWGKNPLKTKPYWLLYLVLVVITGILILIHYLP